MPEHDRPRMGRWVAVAGLSIVVAAAVVLALVDWTGGPKDVRQSTATATSGGSPAPAVKDPGPPSAARICGKMAQFGVKTPPAGSVVVKTTDDLPGVVEANKPGTTYWLSPGVHRFSVGEFSQVGPQPGDTFIGAPGAIIDGQNKNRYAFGGDSPDVTIRALTIQNFGTRGGNPGEGVVNHDSGKGWTIEHVTVQRVAGAGVMLGVGNKLLGSCLRDNGQYGFQGFAVDGSAKIEVRDNEVSGNNTDNWEARQEGCGCTGGAKFWDVRGAVVTGNYVHDNRGAGLWADSNNSGFLFSKNYIADNDGVGIMYELGYNASIVDNTFIRNALVDGPRNPGFPTGAVYVSEAGSDARVPGPYGNSFTISGNLFVNNWSGVIGWENADRFSGSPANTSTGVSTLVNRSATVAACSNPARVATKPLLDDCRWKTQNLDVSRNTFVLDPKAVKGCAADRGCGFNGVFSQVGTFPDWSPYKDYVVPDNITFKQHNVWRQNTYSGPWKFVARTADNLLDFRTWQAAPYRQDGGSTLTR